jgi:hypothetical protein
MNFQTHIHIKRQPVLNSISYQNSMMLFGSCFAENIGKRLDNGKFKVDVNPFGVLYNPMSVAGAIKRLLQPEAWSTKDLFLHEGMYHSWFHHSSFSAVSETECLYKMNERLRSAASHLQQADWLLVTFGTAYAYRLKETGRIVANCHKLPDKRFEHERLSVSQIVDEWEELLAGLWRMNPALKALFTVSPIRHWKDGAHENQLSKSILLLAIEQLQKQHSKQIMYFPAYELMMDELRDYRFYAGDMLHPSETAIQYIWERFTEAYLDQTTRETLRKVSGIQMALNHKPLNSKNELYKQFLLETLLKIERLCAKNPYLCFENEVKQINEIQYQGSSDYYRGEI